MVAVARAKPFEFPADTFSFSNQLYFDYLVNPSGELTIQRRANGKVARLFSSLLCVGTGRDAVP
jgi:hypothetical protein